MEIRKKTKKKFVSVYIGTHTNLKKLKEFKDEARIKRNKRVTKSI